MQYNTATTSNSSPVGNADTAALCGDIVEEVSSVEGSESQSSRSGFQLGYEAVKIHGITEIDNKILFLIEW